MGIPGTGSPELAAMKHAAHQARSPTPISILIKLALGKFGAAAGEQITSAFALKDMLNADIVCRYHLQWLVLFIVLGVA